MDSTFAKLEDLKKNDKPLFDKLLKEGYIIESHNGDIFFNPTLKLECHGSNTTSKRGLKLGERCRKNVECSSIVCSSGILKPSGICIPKKLKGQVSLGGKCLENNECKSPYQCINGICAQPIQKSQPLPQSSANLGTSSQPVFADPLKTLARPVAPGAPAASTPSVPPNVPHPPIPCSYRAQKICSRLGDIDSNITPNIKPGSFISDTKKHCCVGEESNLSVCVRDTNSTSDHKGTCIKYDSKYPSIDESIKLLPNGVRCKEHNECSSKYCNQSKKMCGNSITKNKNKQCDTLHPCILTQECVNGECIDIEDIKVKTQQPSEPSRASTICIDELSVGDGKLEDRGKETGKMFYPINRFKRLFSDAHCYREMLDYDDYYKGYNEGGLSLDSCRSSNPEKTLYKQHLTILDTNCNDIHLKFIKQMKTFISTITDDTLPKMILFNNFQYHHFDRAASFDLFDFTSQTALILVGDKYVLSKMYYMLDTPYHFYGAKTQTTDTPSAPTEANDAEANGAEAKAAEAKEANALSGGASSNRQDGPTYSFKGYIFCFYIDPSYSLSKLSDIGGKIKCFTNYKDNTSSLPENFSAFPAEFNIKSGTIFDPNNPSNKSVLLVTNLFLYEYLIALLFDKKKINSPYKTSNYDSSITLLDNNTSGYYHYYIDYHTITNGLIDKLKTTEIDYCSQFGENKSFDIPYSVELNNDISSFKPVMCSKIDFLSTFNKWVEFCKSQKYYNFIVDKEDIFMFRCGRRDTYLIPKKFVDSNKSTSGNDYSDFENMNINSVSASFKEFKDKKK